MKSYLTATRLVTKLQMLRSGKKSKAFVVVEGITDYRLYQKVVDTSRCEVIIGESKQNVVEAIKQCEKQDLEGIIGIVDADFDHMQQDKVLPKSLFMTDYHDLETMMMHSRAYDNVLLEYSDINKLARFEMRCKKSLRELLCENIALIGYLRKLSLEQHLNLNFNDLNFMEFTYVSNLALQEDKLIHYLLFRSKKLALKNNEQIGQLLHKSILAEDDLWQVCCGHDLMELMTIGLIHLFGNYNAKKLIAGQLEGCFRLAYQESYFEETKLYEALCHWQEENRPYQVVISK